MVLGITDVCEALENALHVLVVPMRELHQLSDTLNAVLRHCPGLVLLNKGLQKREECGVGPRPCVGAQLGVVAWASQDNIKRARSDTTT